MNREEFRVPRAGRVIQAPSGYLAFIPAPLPPSIAYNQNLVMALSRADAALSELSGLGRHLPNPHLFISSYIRKEAVLSSQIEGTRAGLSDLWLVDLEPESLRVENPDLLEVRNYIHAMEYGIQRLHELPLSLRLVREVHARLMDNVRGGAASPGEFRRSQNWIGPAGSTLANAPYVPPPPEEMLTCLANWEIFLQDRSQFPDLIQCALLHAQFEAIHPFLDGNGRIGRLLITLFLIERKRLTQPLLYLSAYLEANRDAYYAGLQKVRTNGDWDSWFLFFLSGVAETARQAVLQAGQLVQLRDQYQTKLLGKPKASAIIDELFVNPYITVARAAQFLQTSTPTARQVIIALQNAGILEEITGRDWGRVYQAKSISKVIETHF